jgi:hypothetical protein
MSRRTDAMMTRRTALGEVRRQAAMTAIVHAAVVFVALLGAGS